MVDNSMQQVAAAAAAGQMTSYINPNPSAYTSSLSQPISPSLQVVSQQAASYPQTLTSSGNNYLYVNDIPSAPPVQPVQQVQQVQQVQPIQPGQSGQSGQSVQQVQQVQSVQPVQTVQTVQTVPAVSSVSAVQTVQPTQAIQNNNLMNSSLMSMVGFGGTYEG